MRCKKALASTNVKVGGTIAVERLKEHGVQCLMYSTSKLRACCYRSPSVVHGDCGSPAAVGMACRVHVAPLASHYLCGRKCRRQFLVVSMSHEAPSCLFWWLVVAVIYSESAPPSDVGVGGALSERLGDRSMDRSHRLSLPVSAPACSMTCRAWR